MVTKIKVLTGKYAGKVVEARLNASSDYAIYYSFTVMKNNYFECDVCGARFKGEREACPACKTPRTEVKE